MRALLRSAFLATLLGILSLFVAEPVLAYCCLCVPKTGTGSVCLTDTSGSCDDILSRHATNLTDIKNCGIVPDAQCNSVAGGASASAECIKGPMAVTAYTAGGASGSGSIGTVTAPELNVPIPGLQFTDNIQIVEGQDTQIPFLAQYIAAVYNYLLGISVLAAAVMIVYGGFKYIMSSSLQGVKNGKAIINDAIVGLILVFSAYAIVGLVGQSQLKSLKIHIVKADPFEIENVGKEAGNIPDGPPPPAGADGLPTYTPKDLSGTNAQFPGKDVDGSCNPVVGVDAWHMTQYDLPWGTAASGKLPVCSRTKVVAHDCDQKNKLHNGGKLVDGKRVPYTEPDCDITESEMYGDSKNNVCCTTYTDSACGASSAAVVLNAYGTGATPGIIGNLIIAAGERTCNIYGMAPDAASVQRAYPTFSFQKGMPRSQLDSELRAGHPVVFLSGGCKVESWQIQGRHPTKFLSDRKWPSHYMVLTGIYDNGDYGIDDVGSNRNNLIKRSEIDRGCATLYLIKPKDGSSIKACQ